jgi:hypothetical protein
VTWLLKSLPTILDTLVSCPYTVLGHNAVKVSSFMWTACLDCRFQDPRGACWIDGDGYRSKQQQKLIILFERARSSSSSRMWKIKSYCGSLLRFMISIWEQRPNSWTKSGQMSYKSCPPCYSKSPISISSNSCNLLQFLEFSFLYTVEEKGGKLDRKP